MVSGLISFPILTRIFSKEQYGLFSLIGVTITMLTAISSLGGNRSVVRFYHKYKDQNLLSIFMTTLLTAMCVFGLLLPFSTLIAGKLLLFRWTIIQYAFLPFVIALLWMVFKNIFTLLNMAYRLEGKIVLYNVNGILEKYGGLLIAVFMVLYFRELTAYYTGMLIAESLIVLMLIISVKRNFGLFSFSQKKVSKEILVDSVAYGLPLALSAIPIVILNSGDRYVIAAFLGTEDVATYSVGYNLCVYAKELIISPLNLALMPMIFALWEKERQMM